MFRIDLDFVVGDHIDFGRKNFDAGVFKCLAHFRHIAGHCIDFVNVFESYDIVRARVYCKHHNIVFAHSVHVDVDNAAFFEHVRYASGAAETAAEFIEQVSDVARRAVFVVSQTFHDDCNAACRVSFIGKFFVIDAVEFARRFLDASVDVVVGHIVRLCLGDGVAKFAVGVGIGTALFYSDCDFATDFRKDISASRVAFTFFGLYVVPFAVSTHKTLLNI